MLRNIVYVPQWIVEAIQRQKQNLNIVLDLKQLKEFVSVNDLVGLVALNNSIGELLGMDINLSIGNGLTAYWQANSDEETQFFIANTLYPSITPNTAREALERLVQDNWNEDEEVEDFMGVDLSSDTSAIVLKYGFFNSLQTQHIQYRLIEEILQILYVYHPHHLIANTAIGRKYLELLALNQ